MNNKQITNHEHRVSTCRGESLRRDERAQKPLIMQNKPNSQKAQMNASIVLTKDYDNWTLGERGKNKANTNPIQSQSNPIQSQYKPKQTQNKPNFKPT